MSTERRSTSTTPPKRSTIRAPDFWPCGSDRRRVVRPRPSASLPPSRGVCDKSGVEWNGHSIERPSPSFQPHQSSQVESAATTAGHFIWTSSEARKCFALPTSFFDRPSLRSFLSANLRGPRSPSPCHGIADFVAHPNPNLFLYDIKRTICRTRTDADGRPPAAECRRRFVRGPGPSRLVAVLKVKCIGRKSEEGGKGNGEGRTKERVHSFLPRGMGWPPFSAGEMEVDGIILWDGTGPPCAPAAAAAHTQMDFHNSK